MNRRSRLVGFLVAALILVLVMPGIVVARKGPPVVEATNNLSFPAIAVDGFGITPLAAPSFTVPYAGDYPGLTADEIAYLEANGPWYAQKTTGNAWQAGNTSAASVDVTYIDWSDNMESVSPKIRSPFRIEIVLFKSVDTPMTAYTMGVLEYPSSSNELQGTNTTTYDSSYATVISGQPKLVIQYLGDEVPDTLTWDGTKWTEAGTPIQVGFAPELNVGGKYIFGASQGGWKPASLGYYRITFYVPAGSGVNLALGTIANAATGFTPPGDEAIAVPELDPALNLTYLDVLVKASGGGGRK